MFAPLTDHIELVAGDDYKAADSRALSWSSRLFPCNLAGSTLTLLLGHTDYDIYGSLPTGISGAVPSSPANPTSISLDVPGSATANLPSGQMQYMLIATLPDGDKVTVADGNATIIAAPGTAPLWPPTP